MKKGIDFTGIAVGFACHDGAGEYVLGKRGVQCRDYIGAWEFGGGAVKFGEKVEECLLRELKEELSVEPITYNFIGYHDLITNVDEVPKHWVAFNFLIQVDRNHVAIGEPDCFSELTWRTLDDLPTNLHPGCVQTLHVVKQYVNNSAT